MPSVAGTPTAADVRAARRYGRLVEPIAAGYTNPVTGGRLSGAALLLKLASGESGFDSSADSGKAQGRTQFTPGSRRVAIDKFGVDPLASVDSAYHAAALHLLGKINGSKGLEGYNPGMASYPGYILGQKVGKVAGGAGGSSATTDAPAAPQGAPDAAQSPAVQALLAQMQAPRQQPVSMGVQSPGFSAQAALPSGYQAPVSGGGPQQSNGVSSLLALASQSQGQATQAPAGGTPGQGDVSGATGGSYGPGKVVIAPGAEKPGHGLQKPILGFLHDVSAASGREVDVTTGTNHNEMVAGTNRRSDHADGNAADLGVGGDARQDPSAGRKGDLIAAHAIQVASQRAGEKVDFQHALALARRGGVFNFQTPEGRVQILWRTMSGGNHFNHVHTGLNPGH